MKISKKIFVGMAALALSFGLMLTGCVTLRRVETETSRAIFEAASELVAEQEGEITVGALLSGLGERFPSLALGRPAATSLIADQIFVDYGDRTFVILCIMPEFAVAPVGGGVTVDRVGMGTIVSSITGVYELVAE